MNNNFQYKGLTLFVFCFFLFWGSFGVESTIDPKTASFPIHRGLIVLTLFVFFFNAQQVLNLCFKNKILLTLLFYTLLSALWASTPLTVLKAFTFNIAIFFISIMATLAYSDQRITLIRWLFWLYALMTIGNIITAYLFPNIGIMVGERGVTRWIGITQHANHLGALELLSVWLSINLYFLTRSKFEKLCILISICTAIFVITKADSMTSLLTSIIIISYIIYCYIFSKISLSIKILTIISILFGFIIALTFYTNTDEIANATMETTGRNLTFTGRTRLWLSAFKMVSDHLMLGFGFDNLEGVSRHSHFGLSHLHNGYIEILFKGGIIGIGLMLWILLKTWLHQLRFKNLLKPDFILLSSGLLLVILHNVTESSLLKGFVPLNIFITYIIVSTSLLTGNKKQEEQAPAIQLGLKHQPHKAKI